jgi:hypothetical protein
MTRTTLEERVTELEKKVDALLSQHTGKGHVKDWRRTRGAFTGDVFMKQVFEEGRRIREADRKRAQPGKNKKRRARS